MYNLIEYIDNYPKISGSLYQRCRDEPASDNNGSIVNFTTYNATVSFKFKEKNSRANSGTKDIKIMVPLKYLINFLEDPNFELCRMF